MFITHVTIKMKIRILQMPLKPEPTLKAKTSITSQQILKSRRNSEGPRLLSAIPLTESLRELAINVWSSEEPITCIMEIYYMYTGMMEEDPKTLAHARSCSDLIRELYEIGRNQDFEPRLTKLEEIPLIQLITARNNYINFNTRITNPVLIAAMQHQAHRGDLTIEDYLIIIMDMEFYYYSGKNIHSYQFLHRVYLNVNNRILTHIISYILDVCLDKIPGVLQVKVTLAKCLDKILIYTHNMTATNKVLATLRNYQHQFGLSGFESQLPAMTKHQMLGVSVADMPPSICIIKREPLPAAPHSYGYFLCKLIYQALNDSNGSTEFFELIVKYFKDAGIDANDPAIQTRFKHLKWEAQSNLVRALTLNKTLELIY